MHIWDYYYFHVLSYFRHILSPCQRLCAAYFSAWICMQSSVDSGSIGIRISEVKTFKVWAIRLQAIKAKYFPNKCPASLYKSLAVSPRAEGTEEEGKWGKETVGRSHQYMLHGDAKANFAANYD